MAVFLTGATGFVGSVVLRTLRRQGRAVTALVRSQAKAREVEDVGATALIGELSDLEVIATAVAASSGVIHTASPGDQSSADLDDKFVGAVLAALAGTDIPFVHTGGVWVFGSGTDITESTPLDPPTITAWRAPIEARVRAANVRTSIVAPGIVYSRRGAGIPAVLLPDATGTVRLVGDGSQHWTTVHVEDLAELYVLALDAGAQDAYYIGVGGDNPAVRELGIAAALGGPVAAETEAQSRARLGEGFADALLLDQQATGAAARAELGWVPRRPTLATVLSTSERTTAV